MQLKLTAACTQVTGYGVVKTDFQDTRALCPIYIEGKAGSRILKLAKPCRNTGFHRCFLCTGEISYGLEGYILGNLGYRFCFYISIGNIDRRNNCHNCKKQG